MPKLRDWSNGASRKRAFKILGFLETANRSAIPRSELDAWVKEGIIEYLGSTDDVRPAIADASCVVLPSYREGDAPCDAGGRGDG